MKWAYQIKHKIQATLVLVSILLLVAYAQMSNSRSVSDLDHSVSSIYKDRLMPATYIFDISNHLYQQRLARECDRNGTTAPDNANHDEAIAQLIRNYEATYLTINEKREWKHFKDNLQALNVISTSATYNNAAYDQAFAGVIQSLSALNNIQVGESEGIHRHSRAVIGDTVIMAHLETVVLVVLGLLALVLLSISDKALFFRQQNSSMN